MSERDDRIDRFISQAVADPGGRRQMPWDESGDWESRMNELLEHIKSNPAAYAKWARGEMPVTAIPTFRRVYRIAWDGEMSMSGRPHVAALGSEFDHLENAQMALENAGRLRHRPNVRIETRLVGEWEMHSDE